MPCHIALRCLFDDMSWLAAGRSPAFGRRSQLGHYHTGRHIRKEAAIRQRKVMARYYWRKYGRAAKG